MPDAPRRPHVVVVGGGIAGLAAAHALTLDGRVDVSVLEALPSVGGKLAVSDVGGVPVDAGAEALLARRPEALDLARAVGLGDDLVAPATTSARVWSRGALRPLPTGHVMGVPTSLRSLAASGVVGRRGVARAARDLALPGGAVGGDVSVGAYVGRRLGAAVVDRLVEPLLGGVYAGRASELSLFATLPQVAPVAVAGGSLMRGLRRRAPASDASSGPVFMTPRGGLGRLPGAVADVVTAAGGRVRTGVTVRELHRTPAGWCLVTGPVPAPEVVEAEAVVLATPGAPTARLLGDVAPHAAAELSAIPYASVAIVTLAFDAHVLGALPPGSGFLVPGVEGRVVKAVTFSSSKWGWYADAAPGVAVVRCSIGRHGDVADLQRDDDALVTLARADLAAMAGVGAEPIDSRVSRWGGGLPQYTVGHLDRVSRITSGVAALPWLALCGAAYGGIGVPACVASARAAADRVLAGLFGSGKSGEGQ